MNVLNIMFLVYEDATIHLTDQNMVTSHSTISIFIIKLKMQ